MKASPSYRMRTFDFGDGVPTRVRVVPLDGVDGHMVAYTTNCSGCTESGEAGEFAHHYPVDPKHGCLIGGGCPECGYTGKRRYRGWVPFDPTEVA